MSNYYELLGVDTRATTDEIKTAFRKRARESHPDANPGGGKPLQQKFAEIASAYEVLRDPARRTQYDVARSAATVDGSSPGYPGGYYQPGVSEDAFEEAFKRFWEKHGANWQRAAQQEPRRKSTKEQEMEQAAAWEAEKREAKLNKARFERVKKRTQQARHVRQAQTLRKVWQTHGRVTWVDVAVAAATTATAAFLFSLWQPLMSPPAPTDAAVSPDSG